MQTEYFSDQSASEQKCQKRQLQLHPSGHRRGGDSSKVIYHPQTWEDGEVDCESRGGHLVSILNTSTQNLLNQHLLQQTCSDALSYWIGSNDRQWESDFFWPDQTKVAFTYWFPGFELQEEHGRRYGRQPSDDGASDEDCVEMRRHFALPKKGQIITDTFYWNDRNCRQQNPYVCQVKPRMLVPPSVYCDKSVELTYAHPEVRLRSPGYPHDHYPDLTNCTYFIHAPLDAMLDVEFWDFHLEDVAVSGRCEYDFMEVTSSPTLGQSRVDRRCGDWSTKVKLLRQVLPRFYTFVHFSADHSKRFPGFDLSVRILREFSDCESGIRIPVHQGCVQFLPKQSHSQMNGCASVSATLWVPETHEELPVILTHALLADTENTKASAEDTMEMMIRSEDKNTCERVSRSATMSFDNVTLVTHVKKSSVSCNTSSLPVVCFKARKKAREEYFLVDAVNRTEGFLQPTLANDGTNYTNYASITWTLLAAPGRRVLLLFDVVDLEDQGQCLYDSIIITNSTPYGTVCGRWEDGYAAVSLNNVTEVSFRSDYSVTGVAFGLSWQSLNMNQCRNQTFTETSATFTSFNFPRPFPGRLHCFITIIVEPGSRVLLKFTRIVMYDSSEQSIGLRLGGKRAEEVRGDGEEEWPQEVMVGVTDDDEQGSTLGRMFLSYGNKMVVRLERSALQAGEGFQATYKMVPRPSTLVVDTAHLEPNSSATVLSTNFPLPFPDLLYLDYTLRAPIGHFIHVTFHYFRLPYTNTCSDAVEIQDVSLFERSGAGRPRLLARLCGGEDEPVNDTVSELNSIRLVMTAGTRSELEERRTMRRYAGVDDETAGFNISVSVYPDPEYLEKTSILAEASFDSCAESPCLHNGTCTEKDERGSCSCLLHYTGLFCQVTWCEIETCLLGDCFLTDLEPGYKCRCSPNHFGEQCRMNKSQCRKQVCHGAGECTENSRHPQCACDEDKPERTGQYCNVTLVSNPSKTIGQRLLGEPIWIGLIVILSVLCLFGVVCVVRRRCAKRYACCQIHFKRKEPEGTHLRDGKRVGLEAESHPMTTFNFRKTLLRPLSNTSVNSTASTTPSMLQAPPTIAITKAVDEVTPALPTSRRIPDDLKAEVAARFFASYREAERASISTPLPTDFSRTTDTFLAHASEEPPAVGAIVGGALLLDLHHRKNRDDLMSRSTVSLGHHAHHRRSSSFTANREKVKRCNSTGPYLLRQHLGSTSFHTGAGNVRDHSRSPARSRSLDDGDTASVGSDADPSFIHPGHPRSLSASPVMQRSLHFRSDGLLAGGSASKNNDNDDDNGDKGAVTISGGRRSRCEVDVGAQCSHLFPEVVVHVVDHEMDGKKHMSDPPSKTMAPCSGSAAGRSTRQDVDAEKPSGIPFSTFRLGDVEVELGKLYHCPSESRSLAVGRHSDTGMTESLSEARLRLRNEMTSSLRTSRKAPAGDRLTGRSFNEYGTSIPDASSRRRSGFYMDAFGSDDMAGTDSPPTYLPVMEQSSRRHLVHQYTMDSYFEQCSNSRQQHQQHQQPQDGETADSFPLKTQANDQGTTMRRSDISPVYFHPDTRSYVDEAGTDDRAELGKRRDRRKHNDHKVQTRADQQIQVNNLEYIHNAEHRQHFVTDFNQPVPSNVDRRDRQRDSATAHSQKPHSSNSSEYQHHQRSKRSPAHRQHQQQHLTARDKRGMFKRNETIAVPSTLRVHSRCRGSKRRGHARQARKCSSVEFLDDGKLDTNLLPIRSHSEDLLDKCQCEECLARTSLAQTSSSTCRVYRHIERGGSASSGNRRYKTRDKIAKERRDMLRPKSPRPGGESAVDGGNSWRLAHLHSSELCSSVSRTDQNPRYTKTPSSDSDKVFDQMSAPWRQKGYRSTCDAEISRHRGIDALGSSSSDKDLDFSKRELFMKFFSQGVEADDTMSLEESCFFDGGSGPVKQDTALFHKAGQTSAPAVVPAVLCKPRDSPAPSFQENTSNKGVWLKYGKSEKSQNKQTGSPHHQRSVAESSMVHGSEQQNLVLTDGRETLTVTPYIASLHADNSSNSDFNSEVRKPAMLTSKCSVIIYDDDLRTQGGTRSVSVSNKVSPTRTPPVQREVEKTDLVVNDIHSVVIDVDHTPELSLPGDGSAGGKEGNPRLKVISTDNDSSGSSEMTTTHPQNSYPPSLLSVTTDTDSAVSSAHSRQASPFYEVVNTTSSSTTVTQALPKAKDSAYQTKESSVDIFEVGRETRWRKSIPAANRKEDRRVTQKLHQAAVKLYILQQGACKGRLSRDSAVNTISEDETYPDDEQWYPSRCMMLNRRQVSSLEGRVMGEEVGVEKDRINEEEEHDSDPDLRGGLNPTPEVFCQVTTENTVEEPHTFTECET